MALIKARATGAPRDDRRLLRAPAPAQADVGVAMNTGTQAAKSGIDPDSTRLSCRHRDRQSSLMRGALTTFSIVNDVASLAIIPAMFAVAFRS
jgi:high-affinity K+ transport system ATPase subunit B